MKFKYVLALGAVLATTALGGSALAAYWNPVEVTLRDSATDVLKSDGNPLYAGHEDFSRIVDATAPSASGVQDIFYFEPWGKRDYVLQSPFIEGGTRLVCDESETRVSFFSRQNPDWFSSLSTLPAGIPLPADSGLRCWSKGRGLDFYIDYPSSEVTPGNEQECGTITRVDGSSFRFDMPATCLADVYRFESKGANRIGGKVAEDVSLPFQLTAVLEPLS